MTERVVEAEAFVLKDPEGNERGRFAVGPDGNPALTFREASGASRMVIRLGADGPEVGLLDEEGRGRLFLRLTEDGDA